MKEKTLKYIILFAAACVAGVFLVQFIFLKSAYQLSENQFTERTTVALKEVAWQIMVATGTTENFDSITPVEMISPNLYFIKTGVPIDKDLLSSNLIDQLKQHDLFLNIEIAIHEPNTPQFSDTFTLSMNGATSPSNYKFPKPPQNAGYLFAVHFVDQGNYFSHRLSVWYFLTGLLTIIILFFGYTLSIIIRQRQLSETQKNFINNLTHELKTPISSIALAAGVISDENILQSPQRLFEYARIIREQNTRLEKNVEKVLNLASLEKNRIKLNKEDINLPDFIRNVCNSFQQSSLGTNVRVSLSFTDRLPSVKADKFHFANLLLNLLENAVKYCETKPHIEINTYAEKKYIRLEITDNGIGIPKEHRKKIFQKFYRIPTGNVHNVKGFGLGLDYVHKIVKAHRWKIKVSENPAGGSIFTLSIPTK